MPCTVHVVRYNGTFNSANNTLIRAFATPHFPGKKAMIEGIGNDGTKDDGRGPIIVSSLGPPNTLIRH